MSSAVENALPGDVEMTGESLSSEQAGPIVSADLTRYGMAFSMMVAVQPAYASAGRSLDLCEQPPYQELVTESGGFCSIGGYDAEDGWQFVATSAEEGVDNVAVIEGGSASVLTTWMIRPTDAQQPRPVLTDDEALAITEAVWKVAAEYGPEDFLSGIISPSGVEAGQDEIIAVLEDTLGVRLEPQELGDAYSGVEDRRSFSLVMSLSGPNGEQVDVEIWQKDRLYDAYCPRGHAACQTLPSQSTSGSSSGSGNDTGESTSTESAMMGLGLRGGIAITMTSANDMLTNRADDALHDVAAIIPMLREE